MFSFGANDCADLEGFGRRVSLERSIAVARGMLVSAAVWKPTLWISLPPVDDSRQPVRAAPSIVYHFPSSRIDELSGAYADVAASLDIPYFDLYRHLINDPAWPCMYKTDACARSRPITTLSGNISSIGSLADLVRLTPRTTI